MILDRHPDRPGVVDGRKYIGYWHSVSVDPTTLLPLRTGYSFEQYQKVFGQGGLPLAGEWVDTSWDIQERAALVAYLKMGKPVQHWRGYSWCRFGCQHSREMGTRDLSDGTYVWPEGFAHYVERHGVKPPLDFIEHVLR